MDIKSESYWALRSVTWLGGEGGMSGKTGSKLHDKHQTLLANMLRDKDNKFCADCHSKGI